MNSRGFESSSCASQRKFHIYLLLLVPPFFAGKYGIGRSVPTITRVRIFHFHLLCLMVIISATSWKSLSVLPLLTFFRISGNLFSWSGNLLVSGAPMSIKKVRMEPLSLVLSSALSFFHMSQLLHNIEPKRCTLTSAVSLR